jgi:hypothetical protein
MSDQTPIADQLLEGYRCQHRDGPDGQRCQLLVAHDRPHLASMFGTLHGWTNGGETAELPRRPFRWAPWFPRDER